MDFRELHLAFRAQDQRPSARARRLDAWVRRTEHDPAAMPECREAMRHDAKDDGRCRWCNTEFMPAVRGASDETAENHGAVQIQEAYDLHFNPDPADLPYWMHGAGRVL